MVTLEAADMWGDFLSDFAIVDISRFEDLYQADGYQLAASAAVYVPWFRCTLKCRCEQEQPMTEFDKIICRCVEKGICSIHDISFVLSLDAEIVKGKIAQLAEAGILLEQQGILTLTAAGEGFFAKAVKSESQDIEYTVYMNAVTGVWSIHAVCLKNDSKLSDTAIRLLPVKTAVRLDIENNDEIRRELQREHAVRISAVRLLDYKVMAYQEEAILFYENSGRKRLFALYDTEAGQLDTVLADAILKKYHRHEVLELLQAEKHLEAARRRFIQEQTAAYLQNGSRNVTYMENREIRELFLKVFEEAKKSIFIISPWINEWVVNSRLLEKIEGALNRGVLVTIGYGYFSKDKMKERSKKYTKVPQNDSEWKAWNTANMLKDKFSGYDAFRIFYVKEGTHVKILSYDERYTLVGSYNLLSYDGGEECGYQGSNFRLEGALFIEDDALAKDIQGRFSC